MKIKAKFLLPVSFILGIILSAFMIICHYKYVDPSSLLVTPSPTVTVFNIVTVLSVLFVTVVPLFSAKKTISIRERDNSTFIIFCSSLLGFLFAGYFVSVAIIPVKEYITGVKFPSADISSFGNLTRLIYIACVILAIPCAVYFIILALQKKIGHSPKLSVLAISPILWFSLRLIYYFMQTSAKVNIIGRRLNIFSVCLCVIFFLCEARIYILNKNGNDKEIKKVSKMYLASGYGAIVTLFATQLPAIYLQAFWLLAPNDTYILSAVFLTTILYIASRIYSFSDINTK